MKTTITALLFVAIASAECRTVEGDASLLRDANSIFQEGGGLETVRRRIESFGKRLSARRGTIEPGLVNALGIAVMTNAFMIPATVEARMLPRSPEKRLPHSIGGKVSDEPYRVHARSLSRVFAEIFKLPGISSDTNAIYLLSSYVGEQVCDSTDRYADEMKSAHANDQKIGLPVGAVGPNVTKCMEKWGPTFRKNRFVGYYRRELLNAGFSRLAGEMYASLPEGEKETFKSKVERLAKLSNEESRSIFPANTEFRDESNAPNPD